MSVSYGYTRILSDETDIKKRENNSYTTPTMAASLKRSSEDFTTISQRTLPKLFAQLYNIFAYNS